MKTHAMYYSTQLLIPESNKTQVSAVKKNAGFYDVEYMIKCYYYKIDTYILYAYLDIISYTHEILSLN